MEEVKRLSLENYHSANLILKPYTHTSSHRKGQRNLFNIMNQEDEEDDAYYTDY